MQVNYLGHWLLTHQLLAGQHHLRKSQASASNKNQPTQAKQRSQSSALNRQEHALDTHNIMVVAGSSQQPQQNLGCGENQGTRIVLLTSMTHSAGRIRFDDLHATRSYSGFNRYADSKLALMLAVREFAQRMDRQAAQTNRPVCMAVFPKMLLFSSHQSCLIVCLMHVFTRALSIQKLCFWVRLAKQLVIMICLWIYSCYL